MPGTRRESQEENHDDREVLIPGSKKACNQLRDARAAGMKMIAKARWSHVMERLCHRPAVVLMLLPCVLILMLYLISGVNTEFVGFQSFSLRNDGDTYANDGVFGYLVWNPKCHMLSKDPLDPSIRKFVKTLSFEACATTPPLTRIERDANGSSHLVVDSELARNFSNLDCCWTRVERPKLSKVPERRLDFDINVLPACDRFHGKALLPRDVEVVLVKCRAGVERKTDVYKNVHPVLNVEKVREKLESSRAGNASSESRKLSVLMMGLDSVSRLNFRRGMPLTSSYMTESGWVEMRGYNKIGENTFPNLMAILTGQNQSTSYSRCKPTAYYGLDNCPMLWYAFRNVSYATAYGEEESLLSTFNYLKLGFVEPPTDYYMRPYVIATEKLLPARRKYGNRYCTGPELSAERILDYAVDFAGAFVGTPYFGFFWSNSVTHNDVNGVSSLDGAMLRKMRTMERAGVFDDSMVVFLSDHGMRWGPIRDTLVGWYEERLPFLHIRLPKWFRDENPQAYAALRVNADRLTSPFDLYETLRDVLTRADGEAAPSSGCPGCQTLFRPVPRLRGCEDVGVPAHWCTCTAFRTVDRRDRAVTEGVDKFLEHVEGIVSGYRNPKGERLCARLKLRKLFRVDEIVRSDDDSATPEGREFFYTLQVTPGGGKFEATIRYRGNGSYAISDEEVSRINSYAAGSKCLDRGMKQYCHCVA